MRPTRVHRRRGPRRSTSQLASSLRSRTHVRSVAATAIARDGQHVRFALAGGNGPDDFQRLRIDHGHRVVQFWFQALDRRTGYRGSPARSASRSDSPIIAMRLQPMETSWPAPLRRVSDAWLPRVRLGFKEAAKDFGNVTGRQTTSGALLPAKRNQRRLPSGTTNALHFAPVGRISTQPRRIESAQ